MLQLGSMRHVWSREQGRAQITLCKMKREGSPRAYAIMFKGFGAQIQQMRREVDAYLGISREEVKEPEAVTK
jgi:hypothetical protein